MCLGQQECVCEDAWAEQRQEQEQEQALVDVRMGLGSDFFIGDGRTFVAVNIAAGTCTCGDDACRHVQAVLTALNETASGRAARR